MNELHIVNYQLIKDYSSNQDYLSLMNTTKKFRFIKKLTVYYMLGTKYSYKYYCDDIFRRQIHRNIYNPLLQLGLVFIFNNKILNTERLVAHTVILVFCSKIINVDPLIYSDTLVIYGCNGITNINSLLLNSCIRYLHIESCAKIKNLNKPIIVNSLK